MHSTEFTALAQAADYTFFASVVASVDLPYSMGSLPAAWVVLGRDEHCANAQSRAFSVHMAVFPAGDDERTEPTFMWGTYDLTRERAFEILAEKVARDCSHQNFPIPADKALNGGGPR